ncbi:MAG: hypothetical protein ACOC80_14630 [Petrotogales bacterium]
MVHPPILNIYETQPTSLLKDFATFIDYLKTHHIGLSPRYKFISRKDVYELNQKMTYPTTDNTPQTNQDLYPQLHLFYHLALAGKLFQKVPEGTILVLKPTDRLQLYEQLNPVEQYRY